MSFTPDTRILTFSADSVNDPVLNIIFEGGNGPGESLIPGRPGAVIA